MKVTISDYLQGRRYSKVVAKMIINALNENQVIQDTERIDSEQDIQIGMSAKYQSLQVVVYHHENKKLGHELANEVTDVLDNLGLGYDYPEVRDGYTIIGYEE